ncbi:MAG: hypothetical protein PHE33_08305 [Bacteroidales bacterium]|nr:hypothetical protein [Bacteroidales bacterium]
MKQFIFLFFLLAIVQMNAQESLTYQQPPKEILDLVDVPRAPNVLIDADKNYMLLLSGDTYSSIEELSQEERCLVGLCINPKTNIGSRVNYYNSLKVKSLKDNKADIIDIKGLPINPKLTNFNWSPNQKKMALTNTTENGVEVWVLDLETATATKLTSDNVNANIGDVINWFKDGESLLVKIVSVNKKTAYRFKNRYSNRA